MCVFLLYAFSHCSSVHLLVLSFLVVIVGVGEATTEVVVVVVVGVGVGAQPIGRVILKTVFRDGREFVIMFIHGMVHPLLLIIMQHCYSVIKVTTCLITAQYCILTCLCN